jgi:hypothetical protein
MDAAGRVLTRLERIERLDAAGAAPAAILAELRALVAEAETWARTEGDERARCAVAELRRRTEGLS